MRGPGANDVEWIESQTSVPPTSLGHWAWERQAAMPWESTGAAAIRECGRVRRKTWALV